MRWHLVSVLACAVMLAACGGAKEEDDELVLSGTIRWDRESAQPVDRAFVRVVDSNKSQRCFVTECDGTFAVRRGDVPSLVLPLVSISVERVDRPERQTGTIMSRVVRRMEGVVDRQRSCDGCHAGGVPLFRAASDVPGELRKPSSACVPGAAPVEMMCPEDRTPPSREDIVVPDFVSYEAFVHPVLERRCGTADCHGGGARSLRITADPVASFSSVTAHAGTFVMEKARGGAAHGGGRVISTGEPAEQCVAHWLGVPRSTSSDVFTHAEACRNSL